MFTLVLIFSSLILFIVSTVFIIIIDLSFFCFVFGRIILYCCIWSLEYDKFQNVIFTWYHFNKINFLCCLILKLLVKSAIIFFLIGKIQLESILRPKFFSPCYDQSFNLEVNCYEFELRFESLLAFMPQLSQDQLWEPSIPLNRMNPDCLPKALGTNDELSGPSTLYTRSCNSTTTSTRAIPLPLPLVRSRVGRPTPLVRSHSLALVYLTSEISIKKNLPALMNL